MATKFKNSVEIDGYLSISSGNWVQVPDGTTVQRPGSPTVGMFRYNTTTAEFEGYFGSTPAWGAIGGGGGTVTEAFKTFAVSGQSSIIADGPTDTLTVAAGNNISLTTDAATDTLTITSTATGSGTVTIQRNNYTGNGVTVDYGVSSTILSENNIQIYLDGVYQDKDVFTTTGTTVTFSTAPLTGTEIEIMHYVAVSGVIEVDEFVGNGVQTAFGTSLSIINEDATQVYVSGVYQSKLTYQTTGNVVTFTTAPPNGANIEIVHIKALALSGFNKNNFTGNGAQTAFTLNTTVNEENMTFVFLQGIYQDKSTYSISGTTLTFLTAPQNGYTIEIMVLGAISASTNTLYTDTFTGNGSTTAYALGITPVDLNAVEVYLNGLYQNVSTLTLATNTLTFATPPPNAAIIEIRSVGFLNSGGTLAPATLIGGTGIGVVTNSPNNFTINNTAITALTAGTGIDIVTNSSNDFTISNSLIDVYVSWAAPTGQGLTYTIPSPQSTGPLQAGSTFPTTTFTATKAGSTLSGTAAITGLPTGITITSQSYNNNNIGNILTITLDGVYPSANSLLIALIISGLTVTVAPPTTDFLVVAGGGGGGRGGSSGSGGGGGAGGLLTSFGTSGGNQSALSNLTLALATNYAVTIGSGGAGLNSNGYGGDGTGSTFHTIITTGGGGGGYANNNGRPGGSGGGGGNGCSSGGARTASPIQGMQGGGGIHNSPNYPTGGGGGASTTPSCGSNGNDMPGGGAGLTVNTGITNSAYAGGGASGWYNTSNKGGLNFNGIGGGGGYPYGGGSYSPAVINSGSGGGGGGASPSGSGGTGVVVIRYSNAYTCSNPGGGLTYTTTTDGGTNNVTTFTAGTGNIQLN